MNAHERQIKIRGPRELQLQSYNMDDPTSQNNI